MKVIKFVPSTSSSNKHVEILKTLMSSDKYIVKNSNDRLRKCHIVNLNWYEGGVDRKPLIKGSTIFLLKFLMLVKYKLFRTKIIYTIHNTVPHDSQNPKISKMFMSIIIWFADIVVIHSKNSLFYLDFLDHHRVGKKLEYVPLPNYINSYDYDESENIRVSEFRNRYRNHLFVLYFGLVRPYKNIELLVEVSERFLDKKIKFLIIGEPESNKYKDNLENIIRNSKNEKNIFTIFEFIEDKYLKSIFSLIDIVCLPYDIKSSLNSGAIILSLSMKRTTLSPKISTLDDYENDFFYSYNYNSTQEHKLELEKKLNEVYNDYLSGSLGKKHQLAYDSVLKVNSHEIIKNSYYSIFEKLISK